MLLSVPMAGLAHDDAAWIAQQNLKSRVGETCCGTNDCTAIDPKDVSESPGGYIIGRSFGGDELVPYSEAMPFSIDGRLWICRKPDGSRRCVFNRPPGA